MQEKGLPLPVVEWCLYDGPEGSPQTLSLWHIRNWVQKKQEYLENENMSKFPESLLFLDLLHSALWTPTSELLFLSHRKETVLSKYLVKESSLPGTLWGAKVDA